MNGHSTPFGLHKAHCLPIKAFNFLVLLSLRLWFFALLKDPLCAPLAGDPLLGAGNAARPLPLIKPPPIGAALRALTDSSSSASSVPSVGFDG
jgi:hypothetical protein